MSFQLIGKKGMSCRVFTVIMIEKVIYFLEQSMYKGKNELRMTQYQNDKTGAIDQLYNFHYSISGFKVKLFR